MEASIADVSVEWCELPALEFVDLVSVDIGSVDLTMLNHLREQSE
jgi:hypothetical protein